ncbi:putative zinc-binding protein [Oceanibaculum nanhaiense]|uniref:putative zinc-binding protein n=1 Tax=Oceanibaculum nanhaiense TaxID=1909734 RepID=UPI003D26A0CD
MTKRSHLPLVYSCSGCSSAAQLANYLALTLDHEGAAEMSCIAGLGGDVPSLVRLARSGRPIIAIDGCPLFCVRNSLARHGVLPTLHHNLGAYGVRKKLHTLFDPADADTLLPSLREEAHAMAGRVDVPVSEAAE